MVQLLKAGIALAEDLNLLASTQAEWLTVTSNSNSKGSDSLF